MFEERVADGWEVWHRDPDERLILTFRPDVFDGETFPPACLPTITVSRDASRRRRPSRGPLTPTRWVVALLLEPEVELDRQQFDRQCEATEAALELAEAFASGKLSVREAYQRPREAYLDRLEALIGDRT